MNDFIDEIAEDKETLDDSPRLVWKPTLVKQRYCCYCEKTFRNEIHEYLYREDEEPSVAELVHAVCDSCREELLD